MNYAFARNQYARSKQAALSNISDPHEMILLTLRELTRNLALLDAPNLGAAKRKNHFSKAFTAIYILQTSLDFEAGSEIAQNLFKIYEYCRGQLLLALKGSSDHDLKSCITIVNDIIDAWEQIK